MVDFLDAAELAISTSAADPQGVHLRQRIFQVGRIGRGPVEIPAFSFCGRKSGGFEMQEVALVLSAEWVYLAMFILVVLCALAFIAGAKS